MINNFVNVFKVLRGHVLGNSTFGYLSPFTEFDLLFGVFLVSFLITLSSLHHFWVFFAQLSLKKLNRKRKKSMFLEFILELQVFFDGLWASY